MDALLDDPGRQEKSSRAVRDGITSRGFGSLTPGLVQADPCPCRLSTQELVELLKMPTCFGPARRVVLDHIGNRYGQRFINHWAFVRFAQEQNLGLDFTTPPIRPVRQESIKRMLEILDEPSRL